MKLLDKFKRLFTGEKPDAKEAEPPPIPIKPGRQILRWLGRGFRLPARSRTYKKRAQPIRFVDRQPVRMSFRQARLHDIYTSMREANEIRHSHRERQLERQAA